MSSGEGKSGGRNRAPTTDFLVTQTDGLTLIATLTGIGEESNVGFSSIISSETVQLLKTLSTSSVSASNSVGSMLGNLNCGNVISFVIPDAECLVQLQICNGCCCCSFVIKFVIAMWIANLITDL